MTDDERETLLAESFTRPPSPLVRRFSTGIVTLGRKLRIAMLLPPGSRPSPPAADELAAQNLALVWLLDLRHSLSEVKASAALGWDEFLATCLAPDAADGGYSFDLPPAVFAAAQEEIAWEQKLMAVASYRVFPKPDHSKPESPPGKS